MRERRGGWAREGGRVAQRVERRAAFEAGPGSGRAQGRSERPGQQLQGRPLCGVAPGRAGGRRVLLRAPKTCIETRAGRGAGAGVVRACAPSHAQGRGLRGGRLQRGAPGPVGGASRVRWLQRGVTPVRGSAPSLPSCMRHGGARAGAGR